jgi:anti-sigma B factor antagonist
MPSTTRASYLVACVSVGLLGLFLSGVLAPRRPVVKEPGPPTRADAVDSSDIRESQDEHDDDEHDDEAVETRDESEAQADPGGMAAEPRRHLRLEQKSSVTVVHFVDTKYIGDRDCREMGDQLDKLVDEAGHKRLLLDLDNVQYLSSPALTKLVLFRKKVEAAKGTIKLCGLSSDMQELFRLTRVDQIFKIYPDEKSALDAF